MTADETDTETETRRQALRGRRYRFSARGDREAWMAVIAEREPPLHEELVALRRTSAQAFRKRLLREGKRLGLLTAG